MKVYSQNEHSFAALGKAMREEAKKITLSPEDFDVAPSAWSDAKLKELAKLNAGL